ncbi:hypothetical protein GCM10011608_26040 [Micromonospora sonchi]|uniref:Uncharacterized protein n=1 Tax=Micromonospora sonchi TaxID=1763543 RepID=A0A917WY42_9ACTN|nr:hypothetical protein [Micromonospora sonchi]GGM40037.1 hypothetical protein GCM10011608_26040 [Micromonospora sonchi]
MSEVTVRFIGGPAHDTVRALPAGPDGTPPRLWVLRRSEAAPAPAADHLYARQRPEDSVWTMRFVRTDPVGVTE